MTTIHDGHAEWLTLDELRTLLKADIRKQAEELPVLLTQQYTEYV